MVWRLLGVSVRDLDSRSEEDPRLGTVSPSGGRWCVSVTVGG